MPGKHIVILGPPGSGKGTHSVRLAEDLGIKHLSTGDLLREAISNKTELGLKAEEYMKQGLLVPDEIIFELLTEELDSLGDSGWILDGFPRTLAQAEALSKELERKGRGIDKVILIDVEPEIIVKRLTNRRVCPVCNAVYNLITIKTAVPGKCDKCGADLVKRPDDEEETVLRRIEVYEEQTAPVIDFYQGQGGLVAVNASDGIDETRAEILRLIK